jgi:hypothetical protein
MEHKKTIKKVVFEEVTGRNNAKFMRLYITLPEKEMFDHYFSIVPIQYADCIKEIAELMDFQIEVTTEE